MTRGEALLIRPCRSSNKTRRVCRRNRIAHCRQTLPAVLRDPLLVNKLADECLEQAVNEAGDLDYEGGLTAMATMLAGSAFVNHTGGMLEGLLTMSYAKCAVDYEIMDLLNVTIGDGDRDGAEEALATIPDIEPGGHFLGTAHTLAHYPFQPELQDYNTFEQWDEEGRVNTDERGRRHAIALLKAYEAPPIDPAIDEELGEFVERRSRELGG
jgi:trimethylamine:corrinoid methyltransferase-like protein